MSSIAEDLQAILDARYGKDVRQSIHDAIEDIDEIAEDAAERVDGFDTRITTNTNNITTLQTQEQQTKTDLITVKNHDKVQDAEISNLLAMAKGKLYNEQTDSDVAREKTVPSGAMPYAEIDMIGGMSRKCKNVFNPAFVESTTDGGLTLTYNEADKTYTLNGTSNRDGIIFQIGTISPDGKTYKAFACPSGGSYSGYFFSISNWVDVSIEDYGNNGESITLSGNSTYNVLIRVRASGTVCNNLVFKPMLTTDLTATYDDYEPYTDQLIDAKVDKVVSVGKNLLNPTLQTTSYSGTLKVTNNGDGTYTLNGTPTEGTSIWLNPSSNNNTIPNTFNGMKLVGCPQGGNASSGYSLYFSLVNEGGWVADAIDVGNGAIISSDAKYIQPRIHVHANVTYNNLVFKPMITEDTSATYDDFVPYMTDTKTIPQSLISLCPDYGIGVNENCYNYIDFEEKKYHRRVCSVDLGSLSWKYNQTYTIFNANAPNDTVPVTFYGAINILCAKYESANGSFESSYDKTIELNTSSFYTDKIVLVKDSSYTDATAFKTAMNGVTLLYELATEQIIDLSSVLTEDFDLLHVEGGGTVSFHYPQLDNGYSVDMPNTIEYLIDLEV